MRKVTICNKGFFGGKDENKPGCFREGFFNGFFSEGNNDDGIKCYALVEFYDGEVKMYQTHQMIFQDNPLKTDVQKLKSQITELSNHYKSIQETGGLEVDLPSVIDALETIYKEDLQMPINKGVIGIIVECRDCDFRDEDHESGYKNAKDHARSTGHEVIVEKTECVLFNKKDLPSMINKGGDIMGQ